MADTDKLNDMVDNLIDKKPEQAQVDFHEYLQTKMQEIVGRQGGNDNADNTDNEE